ncbi:MAG: ABC transporter transmembrane domain-containing protein, partial [Acidimicrobiia bacterium]
MFHSGGWWSYLKYDEEQDKPKFDRALIKRVLGYANPYRVELALVFVTIIFVTAMTLVPPLLIRDLIDVAIPDEDLGRVTVLGILMLTVPLVNGILGVLQRWASARAGEGIIFDLRRQLFSHLQG